jgi:hypothetical protein
VHGQSDAPGHATHTTFWLCLSAGVYMSAPLHRKTGYACIRTREDEDLCAGDVLWLFDIHNFTPNLPSPKGGSILHAGG